MTLRLLFLLVNEGTDFENDNRWCDGEPNDYHEEDENVFSYHVEGGSLCFNDLNKNMEESSVCEQGG